MTDHSLATCLADWVWNLELRRVPPEVLAQARRALLDTVGVICAGSRHEVTNATRRGFRSTGREICSITGGGKAAPEIAALINGVAAHAYDFDDASHTGIMHGSAVIVPAAVAVMEEVNATDEQLLTAIIAGSEITYLLADTLSHRHYFRGWWSTVTLSVIGATAAVAKLYGSEPGHITHGIALAAAGAGGARAVVGYDAKPFLCGYTAKTAIELAVAAGMDISGPADVFENNNGFFSLLNDRFSDPTQLATLGSTWRLIEPGLLFKRYPVCSCALALIEQCAALKTHPNFATEKVREIHCRVPELVAQVLVYDDPQTPQQSQFSIPFCVACGLHYGDFKLEHLAPKMLFDPEIRITMSKVKVSIDQELSTQEMRRKYPESARVEIRLADDTVIGDTCLLATGMPARPLTNEYLAQKFRACGAYANADKRSIDTGIEVLMHSGTGPGERRIKPVLDALWHDTLSQ